MIADLQTAYFDEIEQPGFVRADQILEEIISARDTSFIALLENVKDSVDVRMSEFPPDMGTHGPNDDKIRNLVRMKYDLSVSLHQLGLFQAGAVGLEEQYELTMEIVNERIDKIPIDVGVQIVFMRENATSFTPFLLQTLDSIEVVDDKKGSMIADILRYSEYQDLDKHIVKRVDRFESEYSVWGRLIHALEGHASEPAVDFLLNKFRTTPDENKKKTMLSVLCEFSKEPINNELVRMIEIVIDENRNLLSSFSRCKN
ncbi:MAG: hypothetical protein AAFZ15_18940 [Bacteroidota bacterium]